MTSLMRNWRWKSPYAVLAVHQARIVTVSIHDIAFDGQQTVLELKLDIVRLQPGHVRVDHQLLIVFENVHRGRKGRPRTFAPRDAGLAGIAQCVAHFIDSYVVAAECR
jgi:hypothetical protein